MSKHTITLTYPSGRVEKYRFDNTTGRSFKKTYNEASRLKEAGVITSLKVEEENEG